MCLEGCCIGPCASALQLQLLAARADFYIISHFQPALLNRSFSAPELGFLPSVDPCSSRHNRPLFHFNAVISLLLLPGFLAVAGCVMEMTLGTGGLAATGSQMFAGITVISAMAN